MQRCCECCAGAAEPLTPRMETTGSPLGMHTVGQGRRKTTLAGISAFQVQMSLSFPTAAEAVAGMAGMVIIQPSCPGNPVGLLPSRSRKDEGRSRAQDLSRGEAVPALICSGAEATQNTPTSPKTSLFLMQYRSNLLQWDDCSSSKSFDLL